MIGTDYWPLDLSGVYNAPTTILEDPQDVVLGERSLHGLPFRFARSDSRHTLLLLDKASPDRTVTVPLAAKAKWILFAHALLEPDLYDGTPVGAPCAEYIIRYSDGTSSRRQLRQRFEIGPTPRRWHGRALPLDWGQTPFLAVNDAQHRLMDRCCGRYDQAGARWVDIEDPQSRIPYVLPYRFYLWPFANPSPEKEIARLELRSAGASILIGAITVSARDEDPFGRGVSRDVIVTLNDRPMDETVEVSVDRGLSSYTYRLAGGTLGRDPDFPKAWGAASHADPGAGYVKITAQPSATVHIHAARTEVAQCRWGDLLERGELSIAGRVTLRLAASDRTWVRTRITDAKTGELLACRIHMRSIEGIPLAPYGHHPHLNSDGNTWNIDIGGDVRLGAQTYAYVNGECEGWLPVGEIVVEIAKGFGYRPLHRIVRILPGQRELALALEPFSDARALGYYSGDTHVHFVSTQGSELEARSEDVDVVNLLMSQWGHLYTNTEDFTGRPHVSADKRTVVFACQENRTNMLGHISLLGTRKPILPWCTGGSEEADLGGGLETTLCRWADECHADGGTVVLAHFPVPNGESAALVATERLDAVELIVYDDYNVNEYYRYLNCGYRLPLVAGTDKMTSEVPIGLIRTYSRVDGPLDYWAWCDGIKRGDTFVSSGPLLTLSVDGVSPGTLLVEHGGKRVAIKAVAESIFPIDRLEIVRNGSVIARKATAEPTERIEIDYSFVLEEDSWIVARCYAPGSTVARHHDVWRRPVMAHTSPVYLASGETYDPFDADTARHMQSLIEGARLYIHERARVEWPGAAAHRHGEPDHLAFLTAPLDEALAALERRWAKHSKTVR